ncbi:hypothetical protein HHX47_DHR3001207, partial [Lentinula edodes]
RRPTNPVYCFKLGGNKSINRKYLTTIFNVIACFSSSNRRRSPQSMKITISRDSRRKKLDSTCD